MKKIPLILIILACAVAAYVGWRWLHHPPAEEPTDNSVAVVLQPIEKKMLTETVEAYGTISSDSSGVININVPRQAIIGSIDVLPGQSVKKGQLLIELGSDPEASVVYTQASTALNTARSEFTRTKQLVDEQLATDSQLAAAQKALSDAEAIYKAQQQMGGGLSSQKITAPFDGTITTLSIARGDRVAPGTAMLQISASHALRAELGIEPKECSRIKPGMKVIAAPVFDKDAKVEGSITQVQSMINPTSQLVMAFASVSNDEGVLIQGGAVRATIIIDTKEAYAVPREAVLLDDKGEYIFQVKDGKAQRANVKDGLEFEGYVGIEGDFDPNLPVVASGNYELQDGVAVREDKPETPDEPKNQVKP